MNRKSIILLVVFLGGISLAPSLVKQRLFKSPPPGTIAINDSFYVDKVPVQTIDYLEFLASIRYRSYSPRMRDTLRKLPLYGLIKDSIEAIQQKIQWDSSYYLKMLPRTWITYANDIKKYDVDYHIKSEKYYDYPVINLNYLQVFEYCKWRTDMVKIHYAIMCSNEKKRKRYPMNFEYRLATKKEWELILGHFFEDVVKLDKSTSSKKNYVNNVADIYVRNDRFQYNSNNVGEMLDHFVIATGFVWDDRYNMGTINYVKYVEPSDWAGFRCVCEIIPMEGRKNKKVQQKVLRDKYGREIASRISERKKDKKPKGTKSKTKTKAKKTKTKTKKLKLKPESVKKKRRKR